MTLYCIDFRQQTGTKTLTMKFNTLMDRENFVENHPTIQPLKEWEEIDDFIRLRCLDCKVIWTEEAPDEGTTCPFCWRKNLSRSDE